MLKNIHNFVLAHGKHFFYPRPARSAQSVELSFYFLSLCVCACVTRVTFGAVSRLTAQKAACHFGTWVELSLYIYICLLCIIHWSRRPTKHFSHKHRPVGWALRPRIIQAPPSKSRLCCIHRVCCFQKSRAFVFSVPTCLLVGCVFLFFLTRCVPFAFDHRVARVDDCIVYSDNYSFHRKFDNWRQHLNDLETVAKVWLTMFTCWRLSSGTPVRLTSHREDEMVSP